jgi:Domain of unknown function (DUF4926)
MKIKEHDYVVLMADLPEEKLKSGDVGTVVHIHNGELAYEVEFMTLDGHTVAVATVANNQLRPVSRRDISHVRELQVA